MRQDEITQECAGGASDRNKVWAVASTIINLVLVVVCCSLIIANSQLKTTRRQDRYEYREVTQGGYKVTMKIDRVTGIEYIFTRNGWETFYARSKAAQENQPQ